MDSDENDAAVVTSEEDEMIVDVKELCRVEYELKNPRERAVPPVQRDAKVNMLKFLQIQAVQDFEQAYDDLYHKLNMEGGLECVRSIARVRSKDLLQPKVFALHDCDDDTQLAEQLQFYLADAKRAKQHLDKLLKEAAKDLVGCEVQYAEVKSLESTRRKASRFCGCQVRKVTDMARVAVVCDTPEGLKQAYLAIMRLLQPPGVLRVKNGFNSDWMPSGYRDVKLNPVVNEHLCEIQLQLREFYALKSGQHAVYEWARDLNVPARVGAKDLVDNLSLAVTEEMIRLARDNWLGSGGHLTKLLVDAKHFAEAEQDLRQVALLEHARPWLSFLSNHWMQPECSFWAFCHSSGSLTSVPHRCFVPHPIFQANYSEADSLYLRSIAFSEREFGPNHPTVADLLGNRASLLEKQGQCQEADLLYKRAHEVLEKSVGPNHPHTAALLNNWAVLMEIQGKYDKADSLYVRVMEIHDQSFGPDHPSVATTINNRAVVLHKQGKDAEAEPLFELSQSIREKALGPDHRDVAQSLKNRAASLAKLGRYAEADQLSLRAIDVEQKTLPPNHPDLATSLNIRAALLTQQGKYEEAGAVFKRSLAIREEALGPDHAAVAVSLNNWAELLDRQGMYSQAEQLHNRAKEILEKSMRGDHPDAATFLSNRAGVLEGQGKYDEAESLYIRAIAIQEEALGPHHPDLARSLNSRAELLQKQGKYEEAWPFYDRSFAITEKASGPNHDAMATSLYGRAGLLKRQGKYEEAGPLYERALAIREKDLGPDHPTVASVLNSWALLLKLQGKYAEAEPLYERSQAAREKVLGPDHPDVAESLTNRAALWEAQGKYSGVEPFYRRAQEILEKSLGQDHPDVATVLNNRAGLLMNLGKYSEVEPLYRRSQEILEKSLGRDHPNVALVLNNLAGSLVKLGKYTEAEPLQQRSTDLCEAALGPEHPTVAIALTTWGSLLYEQGKYSEARPLFERALTINKGALGEDHPHTVKTYEWVAGLDQLEEVSRTLERVRERDHSKVTVSATIPAGSLQEQAKQHFQDRQEGDLEEDDEHNKVEKAKELKEDGNKLFAAKEFRRAAELYAKALKQASKTPNCTKDYQSEIPAVRLKLHLNLATCYLKLEDWQQVISNCLAAEEIDPTSPKALYLRGCALFESGDASSAKSALLRAKKLAPSDKKVTNMLKKVEVHTSKMKTMWKKALS
ncbi:unnamed protein product [Ectocarpus fasciculatus]